MRGIRNLSILVGGQELMLECMIIGGCVPKILGTNFMLELKVHSDFGTGEIQLGQETV